MPFIPVFLDRTKVENRVRDAFTIIMWNVTAQVNLCLLATFFSFVFPVVACFQFSFFFCLFVRLYISLIHQGSNINFHLLITIKTKEPPARLYYIQTFAIKFSFPVFVTTTTTTTVIFLWSFYGPVIYAHGRVNDLHMPFLLQSANVLLCLFRTNTLVLHLNIHVYHPLGNFLFFFIYIS